MINSIWAIDVHSHYGVCDRGVNPLRDRFMSGDTEVVAARARAARAELSIVSPLAALISSSSVNVVGANQQALSDIAKTQGLLQWVVVDPRDPKTFAQAAEMLCEPKCVGVKIHPVEHKYSILEYGRKVFDFAASHYTVVQSHSGDQSCLPSDFVAFADEFPDVKVILSHVGYGWDGDMTRQVRAVSQCKHENVFTDTSSMFSIVPNLIEWAVGEIGAERILYGTDSPLYFAPAQRARVDNAEIGDEDKRLILRENALRLFGGKLRSHLAVSESGDEIPTEV